MLLFLAIVMIGMSCSLGLDLALEALELLEELGHVLARRRGLEGVLGHQRVRAAAGAAPQA